jgi:hypothetical protein
MYRGIERERERERTVVDHVAEDEGYVGLEGGVALLPVPERDGPVLERCYERVRRWRQRSHRDKRKRERDRERRRAEVIGGGDTSAQGHMLRRGQDDPEERMLHIGCITASKVRRPRGIFKNWTGE